MDAFRKCGLLHHDYDKGRKGSNSLLISPSKVLEYNCAFFRDPTSEDYFCPKPFSRIMESDARTSLGTFWSSENDHCGTYAYKTNVPDVQVIMIAKALSENLELSGMTMKELDSLGSVFVCTRCDPLFSQTRDWQSLVCGDFWPWMNARLIGILSRFCTSSVPSKITKRQENLFAFPGQ